MDIQVHLKLFYHHMLCSLSTRNLQKSKNKKILKTISKQALITYLNQSQLSLNHVDSMLLVVYEVKK